MAKIHELVFKLLPHPPYSPDLRSCNYFLFADLKRMLAGKKFSSIEEVIAETEAYFEAKDKSYYKYGIKNCRVAIISVTPLNRKRISPKKCALLW